MTRATLSWIAALLVASAAEARADDSPGTAPAARPFLDAGAAAYRAGDYETAARELERAYRIDPKPAVLYALAQALRQGGRCPEAITAYRRYLATGPNDAQATAAKNGITLCERAGASTPTPTPTPVEPPPDGSGDTGAGAGDGDKPPGSPEAGPSPTATPAPGSASGAPIDAPRPRRWYADPLGGALVAGGAASLAVGAVFLVRSSGSRDAADEAVFRDDFVELLDTATRQRRIGIVGLGLGAALVAGGVVRYVTLRGRDDLPRAALVVGAGAIAVRGRF
jgi:tetratricopeptide (TPR) repeat protein